MILYKPWTNVLLDLRKLDWSTWNDSSALKRKIYDLLSALNAEIDIDVNKYGTVVVEVAFLICTMLDFN